jgi:hypothetical protein
LEIRSPCLFPLHMHEFCRKPTIFSPFCNAEGKVLGLLWCFGLWIRHTLKDNENRSKTRRKEMPNHAENATHLFLLSETQVHSTSEVDESVEKRERVSNTKDGSSSEEQCASGFNLGGAPQELYEQMCRTLYDYYFKKIGFLELLSIWETLLQIPTPLAEEPLPEQP